jgi:hypothetical protein
MLRGISEVKENENVIVYDVNFYDEVDTLYIYKYIYSSIKNKSHKLCT